MILRESGDDEAPYRFIVPRWSHAPTSGAVFYVRNGHQATEDDATLSIARLRKHNFCCCATFG